MRVLLHASLAGALIAGTTGCLTVSAKAPVPLNMPEPPSRVVTPPSTPVEPPPAAVPSATATAPVPPAAGATGTSGPPTSAPARPPQNTSPPAVIPSPPVETPVLQTTDNTAALDKKIQEYLDSAKRDLDRVNPRQLSKAALEQYNVAMQLYKAAEEARKVKYFSLAYQHAEKAALMAALLVKSLGQRQPVSPTSL